MNKRPLGVLERVDLREHWANEAEHFTPWLADENNITLLGKTLGLGLEVQEQEANVGPFRADILCKNVEDDTLVLIENQLERTDHTHLGQILTYAAGLDAVTVVWIARIFTEEHRAAIDWFNRISHDDIRFFGIELELLRIGDSPAAPRYNVVAKPNDWSRSVKEAARSSNVSSETSEFRISFWKGFADFMSDQNTALRPPKPRPSHYVTFPTSKSGFNLSAVVSVRDHYVAVHFNCQGPNGEAHYRLLERQRSEIEDEMGFPLSWQEGGENLMWKIFVQEGAEIDDREQWSSIYAWLFKTLEAYERVLVTRARALDASQWSFPGA